MVNFGTVLDTKGNVTVEGKKCFALIFESCL